MEELSSRTRVYPSATTGQFPPNTKPVGENLELKVGSQVMFLNNEKDPETDSYRWVNGTLGKITDIAEASKAGTPDVLVVELANGKLVEVLPYTWKLEKHNFDPSLNKVIKHTVGTYTQYPVQLAWAVTIHKAQGKTFSKLIIDLGYSAFDFGQVYVALSRATTLEGITLRRPITLADIKVDKLVGQFLAHFHS